MFSVRKALISDCPLVVKFIHELAQFEKMTHECKITVELLQIAAFPNKGDPLSYILIAEKTDTGEACGMALYFYNYSTFTGKRGIHLEDLYVSEKFRGSGLGTLLLETLKDICKTEGCTRLEWTVLDWNQKARDFYKKFGAEEMSSWLINRVSI